MQIRLAGTYWKNTDPLTTLLRFFESIRPVLTDHLTPEFKHL